MGIAVDATITSEAQVTIPEEIRDRPGLEAGQEVEFVLREGDTVGVRRRKPALGRLRDVKESIAARHGEVDVDEIRRESRRSLQPLSRSPAAATDHRYPTGLPAKGPAGDVR